MPILVFIRPQESMYSSTRNVRLQKRIRFGLGTHLVGGVGYVLSTTRLIFFLAVSLTYERAAIFLKAVLLSAMITRNRPIRYSFRGINIPSMLYLTSGWCRLFLQLSCFRFIK